MRKAGRLAFAACGILLLAVADARAQTRAEAPAPAPEVQKDAKVWSFSAYGSAYLLPDEPDYVQPTFTADRNRLHLEARYNYEGQKTGSAWIGYNLSFGDTVTFDLTPMVGGVFGDTSGFAPGYRASLAFRSLELTSEGEYMFDASSSENNFFYTWSELAWSPSDWLRLGLVVQRTKAYETEFDIQRGLLLGLTWKKASFTTYVFNPDGDKPTVVLGFGVDF